MPLILIVFVSKFIFMHKIFFHSFFFFHLSHKLFWFSLGVRQFVLSIIPDSSLWGRYWLTQKTQRFNRIQNMRHSIIYDLICSIQGGDEFFSLYFSELFAVKSSGHFSVFISLKF